MLGRFGKLTPFILREWRRLLWILSLTALTSAITALQPLPMKLLVDQGLRGEPLPAAVAAWLAVWNITPTPQSLIALAAIASIAFFALASLVDIGLTWLWSTVGQRMVHALSTALFHRLQRRSLQYHSSHSVGDALSRLSGDTWCVYTLTSQFFGPVGQIFTLAAIGVVAWRLNSQLALLSLASAPLLGLISVYFGRRLKGRQKKVREAETRLVAFVHQTLSSIPVVQAFTTEDQNATHFQRLASETVTAVQRRSVFAGSYGLLTSLISALGFAIVVLAGGRRVLAGTLSVGGLIVFLTYMQRMQKAAEGLLQTFGNLKPVEASIERAMEVLEPDAYEPQNSPAARVLASGATRGHIRLESVTYGYAPERPVLRGIDLEVRAGETIGLVGSTGAGKSTLVSLIPRFLDPWTGRVLLDGSDVREIQLTSLREQIGMVLQEPFLFPSSVAENIAYGRLDATREQIAEAARAANADDFIRRLPQGYETVLGERGATLSGGERQRLAIARALLKNAPVLILDEPTSSLDSDTETLLLDALERLMTGRTTFVIAHRLSTIRRADRILVLEHGAIVEQGTHDQLLGISGTYSRLHAHHYTNALSGSAT